MSGNPVSAVVSGSEGAMATLANEMRGWYRATFMPEPGERTGEVQRVEVASKRPGVKAEARSQVLIPRPTSTTQPKAPKDMLKEARVYRDSRCGPGVFLAGTGLRQDQSPRPVRTRPGRPQGGLRVGGAL